MTCIYTIYTRFYMEERSAIINLRIEPSLKAAFERVANKADSTTSQMIRGWIRHVVAQEARESAQGALELPSLAPSKPKKGQRLAEASKRAARGNK
jgi:hypothetical protein